MRYSNVNKITKLANRFEMKIRRLGQIEVTSKEDGVHATILFGEQPQAKVRAFVNKAKAAMSPVVQGLSKKYKSNVKLVLYPVFTNGGDNKDSGKIASEAELTIDNIDNESELEGLKQSLKEKFNQIYKSVSGKRFEERANELNSRKEFPDNAERMGPYQGAEISVYVEVVL